MADDNTDTMDAPALGRPDGATDPSDVHPDEVGDPPDVHPDEVGGPPDAHPDEDWRRPAMYRAVVELAADGALLDDPDAVRDLVESVVAEFDFELVSYDTTRFEPIGVTGIGVLGESHISVHTWPEHGYAHVELLTCSPLPGPAELRRRFPLDGASLVEVRRGDP